MNRKLISKAISDIDDGFITEAMCPPAVNAGQPSERTSKMGKYENRRNSTGGRRLLALASAACLVLTLGITAYAVNLFGIREMFRTDYRELPEAADPYIQHHTEATAAQEDWSARVTESLCDTSKILTTVTVYGGDKYVVVPTDAMAGDSVGIIGLQGEQTLGEYAAAQGKELLFVGATLRHNAHLGITTEAQRTVNVSDAEMNILVTSDWNGDTADGDVVCKIYAQDEAGNRLDLEVPFTLSQTPVTNAGEFVPLDANAIPGITVIGATVEETPMGWTVRMTSNIPNQHDLDSINFKRMDFNEITGYEGGGFVLEDDGTWSSTWTMGKGEIGNTLTVNFYDWDNALIGQIVFERKT